MMIASDTTELSRLDEMDRDEFRDVVRAISPQTSDEEFDEAWAEFQEMKRQHLRRRALN